MMVGPLLFAWGLLIFISDPADQHSTGAHPTAEPSDQPTTDRPPAAAWRQDPALLGMTVMTSAGIIMGFGAVGIVQLVRDTPRVPRQRSRNRYGPGPP